MTTMEKHYHIGYTQGVFDMFHIGHLNLLNHAKECCDILLVGVNADALVQEYKHKTPVIREDQRLAIVQNIKSVDDAFLVYTLDKRATLGGGHPFDAVFIGDDWKGNERWEQTEEELATVGVDVVYLPHTPETSSTMLRTVAEERVEDDDT